MLAELFPFAVAVALVVGFTGGTTWYRWRLRRAIRLAVVEPPSVPDPPIDHDAMFRILKEWGNR